MGLSLSLKYLTQLSPERYEFRRRVPESAKAAVGKSEFKRVFNATTAAAVAREHARIMAEFDKLVATGKTGAASLAHTPREAAEVHLKRAAELLGGVIGPEDEDEKRSILADTLAEAKADPGLYRAVVKPEAPLPGHTLEDARKLYLKEKLNGGEGEEHKDAAEAVARVFTRLQEALGDKVRTCPIEGLKREDARKVRDHMLSREKKGGGTMSPTSVRRELNTLSAVVNLALREFDLRGKAVNPFEGLQVTGEKGGKAIAEEDKRDPLPSPVIEAMRHRLKDEQGLIWRLLAGTGCRLAEVVGLRVEDVSLSGAVPFIRVTWHEGRRLKTAASLRVVPVVGDALEAAKEALQLPRKGNMVFERYARPRGADAASAILMRHLREETKNARHVVHSLRHNMKDALRLAGVEKPIQDLVLGHASDSVGERYGGEAARLEVAHRALLKAAEGAPYLRAPGRSITCCD